MRAFTLVLLLALAGLAFAAVQRERIEFDTGAVAFLSDDDNSATAETDTPAAPAAVDAAKGAAQDAAQGVVDAAQGAVQGVVGAAQDAAQGVVDVAKDRVNGAVDAAQDAAADFAGDLFQSCIDGQGPLADLKAACKLLKNGLTIGNKCAETLSFRMPKGKECPKGGKCFEGTIDLAPFFGATGVPPFTLFGAKVGSKIQIKMTVEGGYTLPIGKMAAGADGADDVLKAIGLSQMTLTIFEMGVSLAPYGIRVKGSLGAYGQVMPFDILIAKFGATTVFGLDIHTPSGFITKMLDQVLGKAASIVSPLVFDALDLTLTTAKIDLSLVPALQWNGKTSLNRGISFGALISFNPAHSCFLIRMLARAMPGKMTMALNWDKLKVDASLSLPDIHIGKFTIIGVKFFMGATTVPPTSVFGIEGGLSFKVGSDELTFKASATVQSAAMPPVTSVQLKIVMVGLYRNAFGVKGLDFGNIMGAIGIMPVFPFISMISAGGEIYFGKPDMAQEDKIGGKVYFSVDLANAMNNWFYINMNPITIGKIAEIMLNKQLPSSIAQSGFSEGLLFSFSLSEQTTPGGDIVPIGLQFRGAINIFGFVAKMRLVIAPTYFEMDASTSPLKYGIIQVSKSKDDYKNGPSLYVKLTLGNTDTPPTFTAKLHGYVNLFLFAAEANIEIKQSPVMLDYHVDIKTNIFLIFAARVVIDTHAELANPLNSHGSFSVDIDTAKNVAAIKNTLNKFSEMVSKAINKAIDGCNAAERKQKKDTYAAYNKCKAGCDKMKCSMIELEAMSLLEMQTEQQQEQAALSATQASVEAELESLSHLSIEEMEAMGILATNEQVAAAEAAEAAHVQTLLEAEANAVVTDLDHLPAELRVPAAFMQLDQQIMVGSAVDVEVAQLNLEMLTEQSEFADQAAALLETYQLSTGIGKAFRKAGKAMKKAGKAVAKGAKKAGKAVAKVAKKAGKAVAKVAKKAGKAIGSAGCKIAKKTCEGSCVAMKKTADGAMKGLMAAAKATLKGITQAFAAFKKLVTTILNNFALRIHFAASIDKESFQFACEFEMQIASAKIGFKINFNFKTSGIAEMLKPIWAKIKDHILKKIPLIKKWI